MASNMDVHRATPGRQAVFEVHRAGAGGREMPLEVAASTYRRDGELLDIFVLRDVSERRRGEAERAELQARLAQSLRMEALGRLVSGVVTRGLSNHVLGERHLDVSVWMDRRWVVPAQDRRHLLVIDTDAALELVTSERVSLPGEIKALSPWRRGSDTGVVALLQDGSAWWVSFPA